MRRSLDHKTHVHKLLRATGLAAVAICPAPTHVAIPEVGCPTDQLGAQGTRAENSQATRLERAGSWSQGMGCSSPPRSLWGLSPEREPVGPSYKPAGPPCAEWAHSGALQTRGMEP